MKRARKRSIHTWFETKEKNFLFFFIVVDIVRVARTNRGRRDRLDVSELELAF